MIYCSQKLMWDKEVAFKGNCKGCGIFSNGGITEMGCYLSSGTFSTPYGLCKSNMENNFHQNIFVEISKGILNIKKICWNLYFCVIISSILIHHLRQAW